MMLEQPLLMSSALQASARSLGFLMGYNNNNNNNNNNNVFICIAARMLDYTIYATQDNAYNITQIIIST